ncbi:MAG TPA: glycoside hydrolase family 3 C-terminal domain-containing protein [Bellilinea sp.]|nr:glycoside hydrolase family 3 C-terminal domain-containing protein [Bellilinea sp.]
MKHRTIIEKMSLEEKIALCSGADFWHTKALERLGIPAILMTDGPHGLRKLTAGSANQVREISHEATCFPTASLSACSWDRKLLEEMGEALAEEALLEGISIILGPGVNIQRNPLCGRNFEYFSEDPLLAGEMAVGWITGVQRKGVGASLKHFAGNNQENLRLLSDSLIDERALRELYLPAFEKAVKEAQPATVMCAYNKLNGTYCSDNATLLRDILRDEWGFEGVIVSDWGAMNHRVEAFKAGLDLEMPGGVGVVDAEVASAVRSGELAESVLDESVDRILELVLRANSVKKAGHTYDAAAHHELARKIAVNSAVLLKNEDNILPVQARQKIAVIGAMAKSPRYQGAGSSIVNPTQVSSAMDGFAEHGLDVTYFPGYELNGPERADLIEEAAAGAKEQDLAIIFAGLPERYESEGYDRSSLALPDSHNQLIEQVAAAQPNTVVVLSGGAAVEMPWEPGVKAILNMLLSGQAGGLAVVDLLTGAANPSGKLAATYPLQYSDVPSAGYYEAGGKQAEYRESIYVGYRYYDKAKKEVLFPFGHGLSYTSFEYRDLTVSQSEIQTGESLVVSVSVRNSGERDGAEIIQLYVGELEPGIFRPEKELRGFAKVFLPAGEEKRVEFVLNPRAFAYYDVEVKDWVVPEGSYQLSVGASSRDIRLREQIRVHGSPRTPSINAAAEWYTRLSGKVSSADFETIYGKPMDPVKLLRRGEFTLASSFAEMQGSFWIRLVMKIYIRQLSHGLAGSGPSDPNYGMVIEGFKHTPLQGLIRLSKGRLTLNKAEGLVDIANGKLLRGVLRILKK